jgi:hypothetical protein
LRLGDLRLGDLRLGDLRLGDLRLGDLRLRDFSRSHSFLKSWSFFNCFPPFEYATLCRRAWLISCWRVHLSNFFPCNSRQRPAENFTFREDIFSLFQEKIFQKKI